MNDLCVEVQHLEGKSYEPLDVYCNKLSKRNNAILYKIENCLDIKLLNGNPELEELREYILNISSEISRLHKRIVIGDANEGL